MNTINPTYETEPSSEQHQESPKEKNVNSPRLHHDTAPAAQETTPGGQIHIVTTDQSDIQEDHDVEGQGQGGYKYNNQAQTSQNETQEGGETESNCGDLEKEKNVSETDDPDVPDGNQDRETTSAAAAAGLISYRKRGRDVSSTSSCGSKARKKGEVELPSCPPTCYVCKKPFGSWKAVFGHLRAHQRLTPGAFPPPTFTPPEGSPEKGNHNGEDDESALREQLAPTLLNLARQTMVNMNSNSQDSNTASSSSSRRGLMISIDLNEPRTSVFLDLNEPAPAPLEKEDDNVDDDHHHQN